MPQFDYDILIIGAGPSGTAAAISLADANSKVALVDKATFPRDKICGDGLSPDVIRQLRMMPLDTGKYFDQLQAKTWWKAVRLVAPNHHHSDIRLHTDFDTGYVSKRLHFDHYLYKQALKNEHVTFLGKAVKAIQRNERGIEVELADGTSITGKVIIGADGAHSIVKRTFLPEKLDRKHHAAGLRCYFDNVGEFSKDNAVELHFYKGILPGYFWVFPLPDNKANVGIGMSSAHVAKHNINLKELFEELLTSHPMLSERFKDAKPLESPQGFGLPLGSKKRPISGDRFLLLGDAASLINPFTGEGIANAIRSARVASDVLKDAFEKDRFDAANLKAYDKEVWRRMGKELFLHTWFQKLMTNPTICNFVVDKALSNKRIQDLVLSGF